MAKVLLVEDDNNLREIYQARLTAEGYDIVAAQDGEEALVVAKQEHPDLIISDVMMPRISGFEMLDILRNTDELKHTKVIMLTALGQAEDQSRADTLGADKYLVKSQVTLEDIINSAKELLGENENEPSVPATAVTEPVPAETPLAAPAPVTPEPAVTPVAEAPVPPTATPAIPVAAPAEPVAVPAASAIDTAATAPAAAPVTNDTAVPASVAPQPGTTVVVPPAPADPTPPAVTTVSVPDPSVVQPADSPTSTPVPASQPAQTVSAAPTIPATSAVDSTPAAPAPAAGETITPNVDASEAAVNNSTPQTIESEEAALEAQIKQFTDAPAEQAPAQVPTASDLLPADAVSPADQAEVNDAAVIANAVDQLNGTADPANPATAAPAPAPAPTPEVSTTAEPTPVVAAPAPDMAAPAVPADQVSVNGKKVIAPLGNPENKPSLQELLAREEAKESGAPAPQAPVINGQTGTPPPAQKPGDNFDPNSISL